MKKCLPPGFFEHTSRGPAAWFVHFNVAVTFFISSGFVCVGLGVLILLLMQSAWEVSKQYTVQDAHKALEIHVPTDAETVHMYISAKKFYANYRTFAPSKDPDIGSAPFQPVDCAGGETMRELTYIRGTEFILNPPTRYVNEDGFFNLTHPVFDSSSSTDSRTSIKENDIIRYRTTDNGPWVKTLVNSTNLDAMQRLTATRIESVAKNLRPCGLNSFTLPLEWFELRDDKKQLVVVDESNVARGIDIDFVKSLKSDKIKGVDFLTPEAPSTDGNVDINEVRSWLKGNSDATTSVNRDAAFNRLLVWYRNSASPNVCFKIGTYSNLKKGTYTITPKDVDPAWSSWDINREVVLAKLSPVGSNYAFIPALCIVMGVVQLTFAVMFYVLIQKRKKS